MTLIGNCVYCEGEVLSSIENLSCPHCKALYCDECCESFSEPGTIVTCSKCAKEFRFTGFDKKIPCVRVSVSKPRLRSTG